MISKKTSDLICAVVSEPNKSYIYYATKTKVSYSYAVRNFGEMLKKGWIELKFKNGRENIVIPKDKLKNIYDQICLLNQSLR